MDNLYVFVISMMYRIIFGNVHILSDNQDNRYIQTGHSCASNVSEWGSHVQQILVTSNKSVLKKWNEKEDNWQCFIFKE